MLRGLDPPGARRRPLRAPDSALPRQRAGRTGLDQGPALDCSCELKGGWSPGIPQLDKSAGCSGVKFGWAMTLCVWSWLLPATCASSRQGQARSLSLLPTPSLPSAWHGGRCQGATSAPPWHTLASSAQLEGPYS